MTAQSEHDALDRLLSEFFQSEVHRPWPPAPGGAPALPTARNSQRTTLRDSTGRARLTLAASVTLFAGMCWYLGYGSPTPPPAGSPHSHSNAGSLKLPEATAGASNGDILDEMKEIKTLPPPIIDPFGK